MNRTIEERATMFALSSTKYMADSTRPPAVSLTHDLYVTIATEQKRIDIDKACEWLKSNLPLIRAEEGDYVIISMHRNVPIDTYLNDFRKAMK